MLVRSLILVLFAAARVSCGQDAPFEFSQLSRTTPDGPVHIFVARIDLSHASIDVIVTEPLPGTPAADGDQHTPVEAKLVPTDEWAKSVGAAVAINANYFAKLGSGSECDVLGLSVSNGRVISPLRTFENSPDPALVFAKDGGARIELVNELQLPGVWDAVAGIGASTTDRDHGGMLVQDGKNLGEQARVEPTARHPRTGAGVSKDGRTLWLVVVDGRQPEYSVGMTLPELGDLLIELGADDALNLDGGGSSSFVARNSAGEWITNKPSDGKFRPVANHLGFRVIDGSAPTVATEPSSGTGAK